MGGSGKREGGAHLDGIGDGLELGPGGDERCGGAEAAAAGQEEAEGGAEHRRRVDREKAQREAQDDAGREQRHADERDRQQRLEEHRAADERHHQAIAVVLPQRLHVLAHGVHELQDLLAVPRADHREQQREDQHRDRGAAPLAPRLRLLADQRRALGIHVHIDAHVRRPLGPRCGSNGFAVVSRSGIIKIEMFCYN